MSSSAVSEKLLRRQKLINLTEEYDLLISKAAARNWTRGTAGCYVERHHIVPRCHGGDNSDDNLVFLTGQEHYNAHRILAQSNPNDHKLNHAWWRTAHIAGVFVSEDEYNEARTRHAKAASIALTGIKRDHSETHRAKISKSLTGRKHSKSTIEKRIKSNVGRKNTTETIERMKEAAKTRKRIWTWVTPNGSFFDYKDAAESHGIKPVTLIYRCKTGIKGFSRTKLD